MMSEFWETLFACENEGHSFIRDNGWQLNSYDVKVTVHPESHSLDVEGTADGVIPGTEITPRVRSLISSLKGATVTEEDYRRLSGGLIPVELLQAVVAPTR